MTLTCIVCKIIEHIICSNIFSHLDKYGILCDQQHGFRHKRSCETQLITTINDFATALNNSEQVDAIFLDLSKAFDTVPYKRLCYKLSFYIWYQRNSIKVDRMLFDRQDSASHNK